MEIQLQELLDQIKKDGVEAAEAQAEAILTEAQAQADKIIADANAQADKILQNAKNENDRTVKSGEDALRQAGRNLLISFRESVTRELNAVISEAVTAAYASDDFAQLIINTVQRWADNPEAEELSVILNSEELQALEATVLAGLKDRMVSGVTLKASDSFDGGFRIAVNNGDVYYDYSPEAVVEMLTGYLSPKVTALLKEAE